MAARWIKGLCAPLMAIVIFSVTVAEATPTSSEIEPALDYAFKFASALKTDPKDMGRAQESVILDLANQGALDEAMKLASQVTGWRRGTVYADLASLLADAGRDDDAVVMIARAEAFKREIEGWQTARIQAHIAQAQAKLGRTEETRKIAAQLAEGDARQYAGRSVATVALAHARKGELEVAMESLRVLGAQKDFDIAWWRMAGYLLLAQESSLETAQRHRALDEARAAVDAIDGWKQIEALALVAEENRKQERPAQAKEAIGRAHDMAANLADTMPTKATILSMIAKEWFHQGDAGEARKLLSAAEGSVEKTMIIDRPALYAQVGAAWDVLGSSDQSTRLLELAFSSAEALENSRPRALAVVDVCRTIAQHDMTLDAMKSERLDAIYASLGDPW